MFKNRQIVRGRILSVQEERVRLWTEEGLGLLLTLHHHLRGREDDLHRWKSAGTTVEVHYEGESNTTSGVIRKMQSLAPDASLTSPETSTF